MVGTSNINNIDVASSAQQRRFASLRRLPLPRSISACRSSLIPLALLFALLALLPYESDAFAQGAGGCGPPIRATTAATTINTGNDNSNGVFPSTHSDGAAVDGWHRTETPDRPVLSGSLNEAGIVVSINDDTTITLPDGSCLDEIETLGNSSSLLLTASTVWIAPDVTHRLNVAMPVSYFRGIVVRASAGVRTMETVTTTVATVVHVLNETTLDQVDSDDTGIDDSSAMTTSTNATTALRSQNDNRNRRMKKGATDDDNTFIEATTSLLTAEASTGEPEEAAAAAALETNSAASNSTLLAMTETIIHDSSNESISFTSSTVLLDNDDFAGLVMPMDFTDGIANDNNDTAVILQPLICPDAVAVTHTDAEIKTAVTAALRWDSSDERTTEDSTDSATAESHTTLDRVCHVDPDNSRLKVYTTTNTTITTTVVTQTVAVPLVRLDITVVGQNDAVASVFASSTLVVAVGDRESVFQNSDDESDTSSGSDHSEGDNNSNGNNSHDDDLYRDQSSQAPSVAEVEPEHCFVCGPDAPFVTQFNGILPGTVGVTPTTCDLVQGRPLPAMVCAVHQRAAPTECGCAPALSDDNDPPQPCSVCAMGGTVDLQHPWRVVDVPDLARATCDQLQRQGVQAYAVSTPDASFTLAYAWDAATCGEVQQAVAERCGCGTESDGRQRWLEDVVAVSDPSESSHGTLVIARLSPVMEERMLDGAVQNALASLVAGVVQEHSTAVDTVTGEAVPVSASLLSHQARVVADDSSDATTYFLDMLLVVHGNVQDANEILSERTEELGRRFRAANTTGFDDPVNYLANVTTVKIFDPTQFVSDDYDVDNIGAIPSLSPTIAGTANAAAETDDRDTDEQDADGLISPESKNKRVISRRWAYAAVASILMFVVCLRACRYRRGWSRLNESVVTEP